MNVHWMLHGTYFIYYVGCLYISESVVGWYRYYKLTKMVNQLLDLF